MKNILSKNAKNGEKKHRDYDYYTMTPLDIVSAFAIGFLLGFIVIQIFFGATILAIIVGVAAGIAAQPFFCKFRINAEKKKLMLQFKDLLEALAASYSAGKPIYECFSDVRKDMAFQHGERSIICYELDIINTGITYSKSIESLLLDFSKRSHEEDIATFANIFAVASPSGGNMKNVLDETRNILGDKIDIEREIQTMISGARNELYVMMIMPLIVVPMIGNFTSGSDSDFTNIMCKVAALIVFAIAFILGRKITKIKL